MAFCEQIVQNSHVQKHHPISQIIQGTVIRRDIEWCKPGMPDKCLQCPTAMVSRIYCKRKKSWKPMSLEPRSSAVITYHSNIVLSIDVAFVACEEEEVRLLVPSDDGCNARAVEVRPQRCESVSEVTSLSM